MGKKNLLDGLIPHPDDNPKADLPPLDKRDEISKDDLEAKLNDAANLLLSQFVVSVREFSEEVADVVLRIPRWQLVCGSLLAQFESGCLPAPSIDPSWQREGLAVGTRVCKNCGETFEPFKAFQATCSNECGTALINKNRGLKDEPISSAL